MIFHTNTRFALLALLCLPTLMLADSGGGGTSGTDAGYAGVNGEQGSCATCHTSGSGSGSVAVVFPNGQFYSPGVKQHLMVTITDTPQAAWGFQMTARQVNSSSTMAGTFAPSDVNTQLVCSQTDFKKEQFFTSPCPSNMPLQYIEHSFGGTQLPNGGQRRSDTFGFDWMPPSSDVGGIQINVSSVAADGDGTTSGDHVYNAHYTLTRLLPNQPLINLGGVVNGASYQTVAGPGSWVQINGVNLSSSAPRTWRADEIVNGRLPTALDGVSVTMDGKPAYVYYISPTQVNVIAPAGTAFGAINVTVTNNGLTTNTAQITMQSTAPAAFLWNGTYVVTTRADGTWVGPPGLFPGGGTTPAKPGDTVTLWCSGLGATTPAVTAGLTTPADQTANVVRPPTVMIGGIAAEVLGAALAPGLASIYQVNVTVPYSLTDGDQPVVFQIGSAQSPSGVSLTVQHQ